MYKNLIYDLQDQVAIVTLNRPDTANAFTEEMFNEVASVFDDIGASKKSKVVILKAEGKLFSGGGDINMFRDILASKEPLSMELCLSPGRMVQSIRNCPQPVIAAVQGSVAGAGLGTVLACDYRIVGQSTKLVPAFNGIGLPGDSGLMYFLGKNLGPARAFEILTTRRFLEAAEAKELGLVTEIVADDQIESAALNLGQALLKTPLKVLAKQKDMLNKTLYSELAYANDLEAVNTHLSSKDDDFFEAVSAFLEKRPPNFNQSQ